MKPSAIVAGVVLIALAAILFVAAPLVRNKSLTIDADHWQGSPLTPCFVNQAHCGGHALRTDDNGRDLAARLIVGGSVTLGTALLALLIELVVAFALSVVARHAGRIVERIVIAFADGMSALPRLPFALLLAAGTYWILPKHAFPSTFAIAAWYGVIVWPAAFFALRESASPMHMVRRAIGDLMTIVLLSSTMDFFGFTHEPPTPTWGNIADVESVMEVAWWAAVFPAACIVVVVVLLEVVRRGIGRSDVALRISHFALRLRPIAFAIRAAQCDTAVAAE